MLPEMSPARLPLSGLPAFGLLWLGQGISLFGSSMTGFALTIWAWSLTGSATALALVRFFSFTPTIVLSPFAGALVDRWDRKRLLMASDAASALSVLVVLALYLAGRLEVWHLYVMGAFGGTFRAVEWPAYSAAVTVMVPGAQRARASGLASVAESAAFIVAPLVASGLLVTIGLGGIIAIDLVTFLVAIGSLLVIAIPQPGRSEAGRAGQGTLWKEAAYGFRYIFERPGLLGLQLGFLATNFLFAIADTARAPMILTRTGNNELAFGTVQSAGAVGGAAGGLLLSLWGGPRSKVHGVLLGWTLAAVLGVAVMGLGGTVVVWAMASFASAFFVPFINGCNQAIWQAKVPADVQGRVFSTRRLIAMVAWPLGALVGGPLADRVFEPAMRSGSSLSWLVGSGPGAGMALMLVLGGVLAATVGIAAYGVPAVRDVERRIPDQPVTVIDAASATEPVAGRPTPS
jgi:DHA3 family macrolide efflux protein-like MFS transporter